MGSRWLLLILAVVEGGCGRESRQAWGGRQAIIAGKMAAGDGGVFLHLESKAITPSEDVQRLGRARGW